MYHLGRRVREKLAGSTDPSATAPSLDLTWDYPTEGPHDEPDAEAVLREINGYTVADGKPLVGLHRPARTTARTACGCWIYSRRLRRRASTRPRGASPAREQTGSRPSGAGRGRQPADPLQPRLGRPRGQAVVRAQELRLVGRGDRASGPATTCPTSSPTTPPDYEPPEGATGRRRSRGDDPFIMQADGKGWLFAPTRPDRRAAADALRAAGVAGRATPLYRRSSANPARQRSDRPDNRYHRAWRRPARRFPYVLTTYRLTEHHTAGGMSAGCRGSPSCSRRCSARSRPSWPAERGLDARRLGDDRHRARGDRGAGAGDRAAARRCAIAGPARSTRSACPTTGAARAAHAATPPTS